MREANALVSLCMCAGSPEHSLIANVEISCIGLYSLEEKIGEHGTVYIFYFQVFINNCSLGIIIIFGSYISPRNMYVYWTVCVKVSGFDIRAKQNKNVKLCGRNIIETTGTYPYKSEPKVFTFSENGYNQGLMLITSSGQTYYIFFRFAIFLRVKLRLFSLPSV